MREIKFKGKQKSDGCWVRGDLRQVEGDTYILDYDFGDNGVDDIKRIFNIAYEVIPETVGQYTGLKDKNGTEIYEGDIIKISISSDGMGMYWTPPKPNGIAVVKWDMCAWMWETKFIVDGKEDKRYITFPSAWCHWTCEIIGNIYENPELLK